MAVVDNTSTEHALWHCSRFMDYLFKSQFLLRGYYEAVSERILLVNRQSFGVYIVQVAKTSRVNVVLKKIVFCVRAKYVDCSHVPVELHI